MRATLAVLSACLWLAAASAGRADDAVDPAALSLAKSFAKICLLAIPNFERVILTAKIEGWTQVEGPAREPLFAWKSPPTTAAWLLKGVDDLPIGVTISRKSEPQVREMIATCAVQNPNVSPAAVPNALAMVLPLPEPEKPITDDGKRITGWQVRFGDRIVPVFMVADDAGKPGAILNAVITQSLP